MPRHLAVIDPQRDFCLPDGALYVQGADEDMARLAAAVHPDRFDAVHVTLDSHPWVHIAHPIFWEGPDGGSPAPFTAISEGDVEAGRWRARDPGSRAYALDYVRRLAAGGRYGLTIWPPHCVVGTPGHAVHPALSDALRAWSEARLASIDFVPKGGNPRTEHYSAIQADVPDPDDPATGVNHAFVDRLKQADEVVFAGEALDYCLLNTLRDLVAAAPDLASRIVLVEDASWAHRGGAGGGGAGVACGGGPGGGPPPPPAPHGPPPRPPPPRSPGGGAPPPPRGPPRRILDQDDP